jgi:hypothetical protein
MTYVIIVAFFTGQSTTISQCLNGIAWAKEDYFYKPPLSFTLADSGGVADLA